MHRSRLSAAGLPEQLPEPSQVSIGMTGCYDSRRPGATGIIAVLVAVAASGGQGARGFHATDS